MQTRNTAETRLIPASPEEPDEGHDNPFFLPATTSELGLAVTTSLNYGLQVPLSTSSCDSGFDYPCELRRWNILQEDWQLFTETVRHETRVLGSQRTTMIGQGPNILAVSGAIIGILGAVPAFFITRTNRIKRQRRDEKGGLANRPCESLARHMSQWNETFFRPKGIMIRLDLFGSNWDYLKDRTAASTSEFPIHREKSDVAHGAARIVVIPLKN